MKTFLNYLVLLSFMLGQVASAAPLQKLEGDAGVGVNIEQEFLKRNSDFDTNIGNWLAYADAAATSPVDGTGGSPNTTCTRTTSSPIAGVGSLLVTKSAGASRQGEGCSVAFTISADRKGQVLRVIADYGGITGTFPDDGLRVYIYDVTNSRLIEPAPNKVKNHLLASSPLQAMEFQTSIDSTNYRLIVHISETSSTAWTMKLDSIKISRAFLPTGPPVGDWTTYTPTLTFATGGMTNNTPTGFWRRVGDRMELTGRIVFSGTSAAFNDPRYSLPSGFSIDTAKMPTPNTNTSGTMVGTSAVIDDSTANYGPFTSAYFTTTSIRISTAGLTQASPIAAISTNDEIIWMASVPIVGWSSNTTLSNDTDTRVVMAKYTDTSGASLTGAVFKYQTKIVDTHAAYSTSTGLFTVPIAGPYRVSAAISTTGLTTSQALFIALYKNGTIHSTLQQVWGNGVTGGNYSVTGSDTVSCVAGDTLEIRVTDDSSGSATTSATWNNLAIERISGPAMVAASEKIAMRYTGTASTTPTNLTATVVKMSTLVFDTHNAYSVSTGLFTAPVAGIYFVDCQYNISQAAGAVTNAFDSQIQKNGSATASKYTTAYTTSAVEHAPGIVGLVSMVAGDTVGCYIGQNLTGTNLTIANSNRTYMDLYLVK